VHARRRQARRRLGHAVTATVPLTELVLLAALVAFPSAPTGTLLPAAGLVAFAASAALIAGHLAREGRRTAGRDRALARAAAAGLLAATIVAWIPILGALALVAL
jgi:hypothetical protein